MVERLTTELDKKQYDTGVFDLCACIAEL